MGEGGEIKSQQSKRTNRRNEPRGPRRGGERGTSFLNWSHWDPQGFPCRTHWNTKKTTHPVDLTKEKKDWLWEEKKIGEWGRGDERELKVLVYQDHVTHVMMCLTNQTQLCLHSVQVLAAEILDHFTLARDQSADQAGVVIQHVRASEEPALSKQPRDPPQPARLTSHFHCPTWILKILTKLTAAEQTPFQQNIINISLFL